MIGIESYSIILNDKAIDWRNAVNDICLPAANYGNLIRPPAGLISLIACIALTINSITGVYTVVPDLMFSTARLILMLLNLSSHSESYDFRRFIVVSANYEKC